MLHSFTAAILLFAIPHSFASPSLQSRQTQADSLAPFCPGGDGNHFTAPGGQVFGLNCSASVDETQATILNTLGAQSLYQCQEGCGGSASCVAYTYIPGQFCRTYSAMTTSVLLSSTSNTGVLLSTTPEAGYVGCPTANGQQVSTQNGDAFLIDCNSAITAGAGGGLLGGGNPYYNFTGCAELCSTTTGCTAFYITDAATCYLYQGAGPTFRYQQNYQAGVFQVPAASSSIPGPSSPSSTSSSVQGSSSSSVSSSPNSSGVSGPISPSSSGLPGPSSPSSSSVPGPSSPSSSSVPGPSSPSSSSVPGPISPSSSGLPGPISPSSSGLPDPSSPSSSGLPDSSSPSSSSVPGPSSPSSSSLPGPISPSSSSSSDLSTPSSSSSVDPSAPSSSSSSDSISTSSSAPSSTISSSDTSSSTTASSTTSSTPDPTCPGSGNTSYTSSSGYVYQILCASAPTRRKKRLASANRVSTFVDCINQCDAVPSCGSISFDPTSGNCVPNSCDALPNGAVLVAVKENGPSGVVSNSACPASSTSSTSSPATSAPSSSSSSSSLASSSASSTSSSASSSVTSSSSSIPSSSLSISSSSSSISSSLSSSFSLPSSKSTSTISSTRTSSSTKSASPTPSLKVSKDGTCGGNKKYTCLGSSEGDCCSQYGYCGKSATYCAVAKGCQSAFGTCTGLTASSVGGAVASPSPISSSKASKDGTCGGSKGYTCLGSSSGNCCSQYGWCGSSNVYCKAGCQPSFGTCK